MFDPVPHYKDFCNADEEKDGEKIETDKEANEQLQQFQKRVVACAQHCNIDIQNRFLGILSICSKLNELIEIKGKRIWKHSRKDEPIEDFQIVFQLLIYLLGDRGLLFDSYGQLNIVPNFDFWPDSEKSYDELNLAMRNRHYAYIQLEKLRKDLKARAGNQETYSDSKRYSVISEKDSDLEDLFNKCFSQTSGKDCVKFECIKRALQILKTDPLCRQIAPLFLFSMLQDYSWGEGYASCFRSLLKSNKKKFPTPTTPVGILKSCENWNLYCQCEEFLRQFEMPKCKSLRSLSDGFSPQYPDIYLFAPYDLLNRICQQGHIALSNEQIIHIANYCISLETGKEVMPSEEILKIQINDVPIIEIMKSFSTIWKSPNTQLEDEKSPQIIKRGLKWSLRRVYESGILGSIKSIDCVSQGDIKEDYCNSQYSDIQKRAEEMYGSGIQYSFSQEAFWLIVGFEPPYNFIPRRNQRDLYSCCFYNLHNMFYYYHQLLTYRSPRFVQDAFVQTQIGSFEQNECAVYGTHMGIGTELHRDILKARLHLAERWNETIEQKFLAALPSMRIRTAYGNKCIYRYLENKVDDIYQSIATPKTSYKGLKYAPEMLYANLMNECFLLAERHLYQEVFRVMALISRTLWPL